MSDLIATRRDLLVAPLLALTAASFGVMAASAAGVDPTMTIVKLPAQIPRQPLYS